MPDRRLPVVLAWCAAALLALIGLMLAVGALLSRVDRGSTFERVDAGVPRWLAARRTEELDAVSTVAAELGSTAVVLVLAVLAGIVATVVVRTWRPLTVIAAALAGEATIFLATAAVIDRPRPPVAHLDAELPPTSSFPSGHTAAAICLYGAIAAIVLSAGKGRRRWWAPGIAVVVVLVVGLARLYRGAHYPTDVLGSLLFAVPWLLLVVRLLLPGSRASGRQGKRPSRRDGESSPDTSRLR